MLQYTVNYVVQYWYLPTRWLNYSLVKGFFNIIVSGVALFSMRSQELITSYRGRTYRVGKGRYQGGREKEVYHSEEASIYRYLGCIEYLNVREERAVKHLIIASTLGCSRSVDKLKIMYQLGDVT